MVQSDNSETEFNSL